MINPPKSYDQQQHAAWFDSLTPDESLMMSMVVGHQIAFLAVALAKRGLQSPNIKPADQLMVLEKMGRVTDVWFASEMVAIIEPMSDIEYEIYKEAKKLDPPWPKNKSDLNSSHFKASTELLTSPRVFWHFCTLNPSFIAAAKWRAAQRSRETDCAPSPAPAFFANAQQPDPYGRNIPSHFVPDLHAAPDNEIPARFFRRPDERPRFASPINPHTGR
jgi:hypothetical protein